MALRDSDGANIGCTRLQAMANGFVVPTGGIFNKLRGKSNPEIRPKDSVLTVLFPAPVRPITLPERHE
jgi:hypothetical protein